MDCIRGAWGGADNFFSFVLEGATEECLPADAAIVKTFIHSFSSSLLEATNTQGAMSD